MSFKSQDQIVKEILILKKKINITSTELENFLQYLDQNVFKRTFSFCGPAKFQERPEFMRAFDKLNNIEKAGYYLCCLKIVNKLNKKDRQEELLESEIQKQDFEISYRLNNCKEWVPTVIKIDSSAKTLNFNSIKQSIRLQNYIIRYSKCKDRNAFVLECAMGKNFYETIRITHSNYMIFEEIQAKIRKIIAACIRQKILSMINLCKNINQLPNKNKMMKRQSISVAVLKSKERKSLRDLIQQSTANLNFTIQDYNAISGTLVDESFVQNIDKFQEYQQISKDVFIHTSKHRVKKVYNFNENIISKDWLIDQLTKYQNFKIWKSSLFMISLLAQIPTQKSLMFHEIDMYKDSTECDYVYLRHYFVREQKSYFIDRSISTQEYGSHQTSNSRGNINYCIWRIQSLPNKILQVIVECEISHVDCIDIYDIICEHIGQLENIVLCKCSKPKMAVPQSMDFQSNQLEAISRDEMNEFTSYKGVSENTHSQAEEEAAFYSIHNSDKKIQNSVASEQIWELQERNILKNEPKKYRYQVKPDDKGIKVYKSFKNNIFFDKSQCIVNQYGELIFVNQQKIKAQSSVLKNVLKRIGTNFFSGKSILNISLPIQIFASDTNLERLCKSTAYAPLFLQDKSNNIPLQKMKAVIAFSIGNILLYINMAKPFNPVIGETFQGFIDGCPIYGEQTSHHPPISTLYFVGKGYIVSANLQAKVDFGFNNVSGINEGLYKVAFHQTNANQNVICYYSPPGELSGAIFGQRKLALINKTRYFDQKNQIFCEISWGKNKNSSQTNYTDYMEGNIVSLVKYQNDIHKVKPSKQDKVLGKISGRWTQKILFNQQIILDINGIHPFEVIEESKPLFSDGKFRKDRVLVEQKKLNEAQQAKEEIEQSQRRDRKLRKQFAK